jgi:hypothetical protein
MSTRTLKIESAGDYWRGGVTPKIRLAGQWLERAGFKPEHRVEVQISQPGTLTLRFLEQFSPPAMEPTPETNTVCPDILQGPALAAAWPWQGVSGMDGQNYGNASKAAQKSNKRTGTGQLKFI